MEDNTSIAPVSLRGEKARMKQRRHHHTRRDKPQRITKAVTHIRLLEVNPGKLAALDQLAPVYLALCQQYVTLFCTEEHPDKFHPLSLSHHYLNEGLGLPFNKPQASHSPGAPIGSKPIRTISMR